MNKGKDMGRRWTIQGFGSDWPLRVYGPQLEFAEKVEVIPAEQLEQLEVSLDIVAKQRDAAIQIHEAFKERLTSDEVVEAVARIPWDNDFPGAWDKGIDPEAEEEAEEERDPRPQARATVRSCIEAAVVAAEQEKP